MYGLLEKDMDYILKALKQFDEIDRAILYGSRAMGNYKKGSDVDIAIQGEKVTEKTIFELDDLLNEVYPLPYFFDIVHFEKLTNQNLMYFAIEKCREMQLKMQRFATHLIPFRQCVGQSIALAMKRDDMGVMN